MSMNDTYQPINCDDYDNLELACQHHLVLTLALKDGEQLQAKASDLISRKNIEVSGWSNSPATSASCAWIKSPASVTRKIGTVVVSES
ncbi:Rho-specific inhibitor of transcription termination (YaeO) [Klebsiella pneumoniae]|uniref:Rho-specific inhibitor of transcription termination (YaeO) n=1 Tax=Klebsiella pneumoniae TaxID=573 RepID=A0A3S5DHV7_KLEPN|nr:Rho-specific inhibitor of transcription termination (YaeO) [Klebsiella pneumoniae]